jgi:broad specificity phosphatase PhoE
MNLIYIEASIPKMKKNKEDFESVKKRVKGVLEKYIRIMTAFIVVCHAMVMKTVKYKEKYDFGEILEFEI